MHKRNAISLIRILTTAQVCALALCTSVWCQQDHSSRKVIVKVEPEYPHLARTMNITGVVKLEAVVANDGSVKLLEVKGGHPVLAQAATAAVNRWKWERTAQDTKESIEIKFVPQ